MLNNVYRKPLNLGVTRLICFTFSLQIGEMFLLYEKYQKVKVWRRLRRAKTQSLFGQTMLDKISGKKEVRKMDRARKVFLFLRVFWRLLPKFSFPKGDWALGYVSAQVWDFLNISLFPKLLSLKLVGNSWGNSYSKFAILNMTFRFTFG